MRNLRQTCAAAVLMLALAMSVFAGQISCPGTPEPINTPGHSSPSSGEIPTFGDVPIVPLLTILDLVM